MIDEHGTSFEPGRGGPIPVSSLISPEEKDMISAAVHQWLGTLDQSRLSWTPEGKRKEFIQLIGHPPRPRKKRR